LDARLRPWLAPAEALQRDVQALTDATLLDEAQALLQRQAQIDRREGLRSALVAELERTRQTLAEVQRAQQDALNPLSQLPAMAQRLQAHASDIQARLAASEARRGARVDSPRTGLEPADQGRAALSTAAGAKDNSALQDPIPAIAALHQAIAAAPTLDALATLRHQLQAAEPLGLMTPQALADIHARMHDAASRLYDRASLHGRGTLEGAPGADDKSTTAEADLSLFPLQALQRTLAQGGGATLVVDGHNVLYQLPGLFRPVMHDHSLARRTLADRLLALAGRHPTLRIELWFDGPGQDTQTLNDQVRLHFSGGTGSDRADRAIVAQVRHLVEASDRSIYIVTADGQIDADGRRMGAAILLPQEIGLLL
jgi:predicted RNA-binding protein with PIN domain